MSTGLILITPPVNEPITLADAKTFLKIDTSDDDAIVSLCISGARRAIEEHTKRALISQTWEYWLDAIPGTRIQGGQWWDGVREASLAQIMSGGREISLPKPPFQSLTYLQTYDLNDAMSVFDSTLLIFDTAGTPGRIALKYGQIWPVNLRLTNCVQIRFVAGYGDNSTNLPPDLLAAHRILMGHMYEKREPTEAGRAIELPWSVDQLLEPYRFLRL